jgi:glycosyltransferase involved in cell wall biosynthesis
LVYPGILKLLSPLFKKHDFVYHANEDLPRVTIIMSVFNEEKVIGEKLESLFKTSYPIDKFSVIIGSDASNDNTDNIIREIQKKKSQD